MESLVLKPRGRIKLVIGSEEILLTKPTIGEVETYQEAVTAAQAKGEKILPLVKSFLETQGLPIAITNQFDLEQFQAVINALVGEKKS